MLIPRYLSKTFKNVKIGPILYWVQVCPSAGLPNNLSITYANLSYFYYIQSTPNPAGLLMRVLHFGTGLPPLRRSALFSARSITLSSLLFGCKRVWLLGCSKIGAPGLWISNFRFRDRGYRKHCRPRLDPWGHARPAVRICHHHRTYLCTNIAGSYRMVMVTILVPSLGRLQLLQSGQYNFGVHRAIPLSKFGGLKFWCPYRNNSADFL